jgi:asparagine synthase (glutamine-hydrolysing)
MCGVYLRICKSKICEEMHSDELSTLRIQHRGPDSVESFKQGQGLFCSFARLSIRSLIHGDQPYLMPNGISAINGELYNEEHVRLRNDLPFDPIGDMQLLGLHVLRNGKTSLNEINGMFAGFVINFDSRTLLLFRDKVGEKPLYFRESSSHLEVMSEDLFIDREKLKVQEFANWAILGFIPSDENVGNQIFRVPPGTSISISLDTFEKTYSEYWRWPLRRQKSPSGAVAPSRLSFKQAVYASVESQLVSDVPIATLLSGGLDSAVVTRVSADILGYPIPAFTLSFAGSNYDESANAILSANAIGCDHRLVVLEPDEMARYVDLCVLSMGQPILDSACLSLFALSSNISKNFKVALSGDGGDELFQGYSLFKYLKLMQMFTRFPKFSKALLDVSLPLLKWPSTSFGYFSREMMLQRLSSVIQHSQINSVSLSLSPLGGTKILDRLLEGIQISDLNSKLQEANTLNPSYLEKYYLTEVLPNLYLEKSDRMSMANGLEIRAPLLSSSLIEHSMGIAQGDLNRKNRKALLRSMASEFLPNDVLNAKKHGFSAPFSEIMPFLSIPDWKMDELGLSREALDENWQKGLMGDQNASNAAWALMVLNRYM